MPIKRRLYEALPIEHARRDDSFKLHGFGKRLHPRNILDMLNIIFSENYEN